MISGGFRLSVTETRVRLRAGSLGIPLLKLELKDVVDAAPHDFSPLADFGGYGIRRNREMSAFFLQGDRGVKLTTAKGKKYPHWFGASRPFGGGASGRDPEVAGGTFGAPL